MVSLAVLYIGFCLTAMNNPTGTRTRSSSSQVNNLVSSIETNTALGLGNPPVGAAEFIASFEVSLPILLACVQDIIVLYPIWEAFEPSSSRNQSQGAPATLAAAASGMRIGVAEKKEENKDRFGPEEAEALVRKMIQERAVDLSHPDTASQESKRSIASSVGKKRARA